MKNFKPFTFLVCILLPLAVGALSAFLTKDTVAVYSMINKPSFSPPPGVFPVVWTILYILMGISSYMIFVSGSPLASGALSWYIVQLFFNFLWSMIFFNHQNYLFAFVWLLILIVLIVIMILQFYRIKPLAALLQLPYLVWCLFAAYLTYSVYMLNR